jgi:hypothetical protein
VRTFVSSLSARLAPSPAPLSADSSLEAVRDSLCHALEALSGACLQRPLSFHQPVDAYYVPPTLRQVKYSSLQMKRGLIVSHIAVRHPKNARISPQKLTPLCSGIGHSPWQCVLRMPPRQVLELMNQNQFIKAPKARLR